MTGWDGNSSRRDSPKVAGLSTVPASLLLLPLLQLDSKEYKPILALDVALLYPFDEISYTAQLESLPVVKLQLCAYSGCTTCTGHIRTGLLLKNTA